MKFLRGTRFDPFGHTAERRMERELIGWYEAIIDTLVSALPAGDIAVLSQIAAAPMDIRGYGPVKEQAVHDVKARVAELMSRLGHRAAA
jgi:indolepyruvate ferredoxin oxidoreductase